MKLRSAHTDERASSDGSRRKSMLNASMLAGTVMLHGIPPSSNIGTEK
jgi:hypothetical protein